MNSMTKSNETEKHYGLSEAKGVTPGKSNSTSTNKAFDKSKGLGIRNSYTTGLKVQLKKRKKWISLNEKTKMSREQFVTEGAITFPSSRVSGKGIGLSETNNFMK